MVAVVLWWMWYCGGCGSIVAVIVWWKWYCGGFVSVVTGNYGSVVSVVIAVHEKLLQNQWYYDSNCKLKYVHNHV